MAKRKHCMRSRHIFSALVVVLSSFNAICSARMDQCYLRDHKSQRCLPPFVNVAFGKTVVATNTCGTPAEEYCLQTGVTGVTTSCHVCDNGDPSESHDPSFLTDETSDDLETWWQSSTMLEDVQYPNVVNLTLDLNKAFDITYVKLKFHTSRPESFAIYRKKCEECDWQPFQYYSGSCFTTYGIDNREIVTVENEQKALCTDEFSDISPLTGGNVAFSTLESRPSAYNFDRSPVLQDWVKAVAIRISLNRINTFGDEVFRDPKVLKSYYYAISDFNVGGRCSCNGHASECYLSATNILQCRCEHNTAGRDCERCADFYNDRPWSRSTGENPGECQACDCNGMSDTCYFDAELYRQTGHGGHCTNCRDNTDGPHCEFCLPYHYRDSANRCMSCECNSIGANSQQCNEDGQCTCKPGVGGPRCDQCLSGYYGLSEAGCFPCACSAEGSVEGSVCDAETGNCVCKLNVEGRNCDKCKLGTMNLQASNPYGCTSCFCYGHSASCEVAEGFTVAYVLSEFNTDSDGWQGLDRYQDPEAVSYTGDAISMAPDNFYMSYFNAPDKFIGMQRFSYNQFLEFDLWTRPKSGDDLGSGLVASDAGGPIIPARDDLVLEGGGIRVVASITDQVYHPLPNGDRQVYRVRLHEAAGFYPRVSAFEFQKMLNNLTRISIRSTYGEELAGYLDNVQLATVERDGAGPRADWVEQCDPIPGHIGQFADQCAPGYTRDPPNGGLFAPCVPCNCNGHSDTCDPDTGICECEHNTMGDHCELCADGYYFNGDESRRGTPQECQPCPCPENSACALLNDGSIVCTNCPPGHAGQQCEICMDGWFGRPRGDAPCQKCMCNGNIDANAIMNCNRTTGECLKCIHNTTGFYCDQCLPGYFGKAVTNNPAERCRLCDCNSMGSRHLTACSQGGGQCDCLPNVEGRQCDQCRKGFWNLESGEGCEACNCNQLGSSTGECDEGSGQCDCLPGVGGQRCDRCLPNYYGLSRDGCTECECNPDGSETLQCGGDGQCKCKDGVFGVKCDKCQENYFDLANGCVECPACYGLVQDAVATHRNELARLEDLTDNIGDQPSMDTQGNQDFLDSLSDLNKTVHELYDEAMKNQDQQERLADQVDQVQLQLDELLIKLTDVVNKVEECAASVQKAEEKNAASMDDTENIRDSLATAQAKLDQAMDDLIQARMIADDSLSKEDNMSRIAQEAETLANRHQMMAEEITDTAQNAYDTSRRAQESIQDAIDVLENLMYTLDDMVESETKIPAARKLREDLLNQSSVVRNNAETAKNESTDLFNAAGKLNVPSVDTEDMNTRAQNIINEADELMPRIEQMETEYKDNYKDLEADVDKAKQSLDLVIPAQQTTDILMAQVDAAKARGLEVVRMANETYNAVLATKSTFEGFDEQINASREEAEQAMANADAIEDKITQANEMTEQTRNALGTARSVATQASGRAMQALDNAEEIQDNAGRILTDAERSHEKANEISSDVSNLEDDLEKTENALNNAEDAVASETAAVEEVIASATSASNKAAATKTKVNNILEQLQLLLDRINSMVDVDEDEIAGLEQQLEVLQNQVEEAGVGDTISTLEAGVAKQQEILRKYDASIAIIEKDIENLRQIEGAIPDKCSIKKGVELP
ncbi:unnamed protein product [Clavelina lepadiformis]|uniref:Laminin subunit gamma-1 n=1 Tax=Clavelina lepadiformis TaxID=159417 RepID=A0ABP0GGG3_CLALP